jgi:hypothetical protein
MKRRQFIARSAMGAVALSAGQITIPGCGQKPFGPNAVVRDLNGAPAIFVDGTPIPPMTYTGYPKSPDYVRALGESGIQVYYVSNRLDWFQPGSFESLEKRANFILTNAPDAYLILRTTLHPPIQWIKDNPDELVRYENGEIFKPDGWRTHMDFEEVGFYSLSSEKWRRDGGVELETFLDQVAAADFGQRVIGFFLCAGGTSEWYYPGDTNQDGHYAGNSPAFRKNFSKLLQETYSTEKELRESWNDPTATFDNPKIPDMDDRLFSRIDGRVMSAWRKDPNNIIVPDNPANIGSFVNPDTHQFVADFYRAWQLGTADSVIHFAKLIKKKTRNTKLVGAFYGSWGCCHFQEDGRVTGVRRLLESGVVDFQSNPGTYENRNPGNATTQRSMNDSFKLRNCIYFVEDDTRTHLANELNRNFTGTFTLEHSLNKMKRDFGRNLAEDRQSWWFDMAREGGGGWYDDPDILALIKRQQEIAHKFYKMDRSISAEMAIIFDEETAYHVGHRTLIDICHVWRDLEAHRIGVPVSFHLHDDLALKNMPDYKFYMFLEGFVFGNRDRKVIDKAVKRDGKTALWVYAPGIINPDLKPRFSVENTRDLTGMKIGMDKGPVWPACRIVSDGGGLLTGVDTGKEYGYLDREMFGDVANMQPPGPARNTLLYPYIYGDDPDASVLARFSADDKPALIARDFGSWRSVHALFKAVRSDIVRAIARHAGCHVYSDSDDILYASKNFVTLHASVDGEKLIRLPHESDPFEIYEEEFYGKGTREIRFKLKRGETKTFHLRGEI